MVPDEVHDYQVGVTLAGFGGVTELSAFSTLAITLGSFGWR